MSELGKKIATRESYGNALVELGKEHEDLIVLDADLAGATKTGIFKKAFPERHWDIGIAEANMTGIAAGLATCGKVPFISSFAMFAAGRNYEQVRNSIGYPHLNVKIGATHAGISVGEDGATHQCLEDLALMREIPGMVVKAFMDGKETIEGLKDRITGRYSCEDIYDKDGNMIVKHNHMITPSRAAKILSVGVNAQGEPIEEVKIRTILTCRSHVGICAKCYGANMATGEAVQVGEAVGIIAAQSIGEPGTQLTMRTFHSGGVAGDDITQGLPRVEELFEARKPKGLAIIAEFGGKAEIRDTKKKREVVITNEETGESKAYLIPYGSRIKVIDGQVLEAGDELTEGSVNPHDLLKIKGIRAVQDYMLREVQRVYRLQGVDIADKHIEVLVRQMLKKVRIENNGDTEFLPGTLVDVLDFEEMNEKLTAEGKEPAEGKRIILGITKAALATESFLSAASFQETTKVLTEAAIKGKVDNLIGLKENVIIGKLIPVGTGMKRYRNTRLSTDAVETIDFDGDMYGDDAELNLSDGSELDAEGAELNEDVNTEAETVEVGTDADNQ